jgi:hypothetical protein
MAHRLPCLSSFASLKLTPKYSDADTFRAGFALGGREHCPQSLDGNAFDLHAHNVESGRETERPPDTGRTLDECKSP